MAIGVLDQCSGGCAVYRLRLRGDSGVALCTRARGLDISGAVLPVIDKNDHLVGIVSRADLVGTMARTDDELREDVLEAIGLMGEESVENVEVEVDSGKVTLRGATDRKTTKGIVSKLAAQVPGILEVVDGLEFESDDTQEIPRQKDPWAIGPLVKDQ